MKGGKAGKSGAIDLAFVGLVHGEQQNGVNFTSFKGFACLALFKLVGASFSPVIVCLEEDQCYTKYTILRRDPSLLLKCSNSGESVARGIGINAQSCAFLWLASRRASTAPVRGFERMTVFD